MILPIIVKAIAISINARMKEIGLAVVSLNLNQFISHELTTGANCRLNKIPNIMIAKDMTSFTNPRKSPMIKPTMMGINIYKSKAFIFNAKVNKLFASI